MTAGINCGRDGQQRRGLVRRRGMLLVAAAAAAAVSLVGVAPAAVAKDVRSQQWYLDSMQADKMWEVSTGEGIKVAVIDSGVDATTPSLAGRVLPGKDLSGAPGDEHDDYDGHGTSMAALIAGSGKEGSIQGLAPGAEIIPFRVALTTMEGDYKKKPTVDKAIRAAADSDAKIINLSLSGHHRTDVKEAVDYALGKGKLLFAGTGNDAEKGNAPQFPASYAGVVGVAALDPAGKVAGFSNYGPNVDLAAPGAQVPTWCDEKLTSYCTSGGTSNATAIASASAALVWAKHPDWTANQVLRVLIDTAGRAADSDMASKYIGHGAVRPRLNLLEGKGDPGPAEENPLGDTEPSAAPSASTPSGDGQKDDGKASDDGTADNAASESDDDSDLWIYLGAGGAVAAVAGVGFAFARRTR